MNNNAIRSNKNLLNLASRNLAASANALNRVSWTEEDAAISDCLSIMRTSIQQTINVLDNVLDDL